MSGCYSGRALKHHGGLTPLALGTCLHTPTEATRLESLTSAGGLCVAVSEEGFR